MVQTDAVIIGAGASGLLASIVAHDFGTNVILIEKENRVGKKILTTGNGRCNFSNRSIKPPYNNFHSSNTEFYKEVLDQLTVDDTLQLFQLYGFQFVELEKRKLYPASLQASSVVDLFRLNIEEREIPVYTDTIVQAILKKDDGFIIETTNEAISKIKTNKVLIACGGRAAPNTGSDGSIYKMLEKLGHPFIKQLPSIVQLKCDYKHLKALSGVRFDAEAKVLINGNVVKTDLDEVLFTDYGISGPAILQISRYASIALENREKVDIQIDCFPQKSFYELQELFEAHFSLLGHRSVSNALIGIIHKKLIPIVLKDCDIDFHKTCDQLDYQEKYRLVQLLKGWTFKCIDTNGFNNAQTTIGGLDTTYVNPQILESTIIKNLYFSGEILDVDGDCGGFNLHWAWSSGYVAGMNLSK